MMLFSAGALLLGQESLAQEDPSRQEQAIAAIRELGGEVKVDSKTPGAPVVVLLTGSASPDQCLPYLKDLRNLQTCDL